MKMEEETQDPLQEALSMFKIDFTSRGLSWAEKICHTLENVTLEDIVQKPSRYVDAFGEQFKKVCADVDDWLKPPSDECDETSIVHPSTDLEPLATVQKMSPEPKFSVIEPMVCEMESHVKMVPAHLKHDPVIAPVDCMVNVSFRGNQHNMSVDVLTDQRTCIEASQNSITSPIEHEEEALIHEVRKVDMGALKASLNDRETEEKKRSMSSVENNVCVPFAGDEYRMSVDVAGIEDAGDHSGISMYKVDEHEQNLPGIPAQEIMARLENSASNRIQELAESGVSPEINRIIVPSDKYNHGDVSCCSSRATFNEHYVPVMNGNELLCENHDADGIGHNRSSSPDKDADGYYYRPYVSKSDELMGSFSIKLEEFEDVEVGRFWDDIDHEELFIVSQSCKSNLSYKKKLKKKLSWISWPSKDKASNHAPNQVTKSADNATDISASAQTITDDNELAKDSCESDWEIL